MRPVAELQRLFTPYELAVGGRSILYAAAALAPLLMFTAWAPAVVTVVGVLTLLGIVLELLGRCPNCRRRPSRHYLVDRSTGEQIPIISRLWPERVCSGCGTSLDGI